MLAGFWNDIRYATRTLRHNPGFAAAAVLAAALGIGINTGIFSVLNGVILRDLPAPQAEELVSVYQQFRSVRDRHVAGARSMFSTEEYERYRDGAQTLDGLMAFTRSTTATLSGDQPRQIEGVLVTCNYFDVLQLRLTLGAGFTPANCDTRKAAPVVVLSHQLWTTAFGADRDIIG